MLRGTISYINHLFKARDFRFAAVVFGLIFCKILYTNWLMDGTVSKGAFATSVGLLLMMISLSFLFKKKGKMIFLLVINVIISVLLVSDLLYFKYFRAPLTLHVYFQVNNLSDLGPSIVSMIDFRHILLFVDLLFYPILLKRKTWVAEKRVAAFIAIFIIGLLLLVMKPIKNHFFDKIDNFQKDDALSYVRNWGPLGHHILDVFFFMKEGQEVMLSHAEIKKIEDWYAEKNRLFEKSNKVSPYTGFAEGKNLILIQVESLQNFVIQKKIDGQEITPHLNKLLKHSLYFPRFYPQTVEGNSSDAELLVNTSLYPIKQGSTFFRFPYNSYPSLGQMLKEKGYSTFALHGDEGDFWNREEVYPQLGFDEYRHIEYFLVDEEIGMGLSDGSMFRQSIPMLKEKKEPFYAFYITLTSHIPFEIPEEYKELKLNEEMENSLIGNYYQSVRYTDRAIGEFIQQLEENGLLENSIVVLYGDHDGIHKKDMEEVEKWITGKEVSDSEWVETFMLVPLIIYNPSIEGKTIHTVGGQIDLMPTLADLLGIDESKYRNSAMGQNLLTATKGFAIIPSGDYAERAYVTDDEIQTYLDSTQQQVLDLADLIIRSDYFRIRK